VEFGFRAAFDALRHGDTPGTDKIDTTFLNLSRSVRLSLCGDIATNALGGQAGNLLGRIHAKLVLLVRPLAKRSKLYIGFRGAQSWNDL
jgi:hypothetical protein